MTPAAPPPISHGIFGSYFRLFVPAGDVPARQDALRHLRRTYPFAQHLRQGAAPSLRSSIMKDLVAVAETDVVRGRWGSPTPPSSRAAPGDVSPATTTGCTRSAP